MSLIVQKFGGSSVADAERVFNVARIVTETYDKGNDVVVVVSAQGDTTDDLIAKGNEINPTASKREKDMLVAAGEQISISLLAMAIEKLGYPVISLLGWQAGFQTSSAHTSARIKRVVPDRIRRELDKKRIVVVAGFQGISRYDDITTLGRGGSDTSAVAIAASMHADLCQIYTDVEGVYTADPRKVENATKLDEISYQVNYMSARKINTLEELYTDRELTEKALATLCEQREKLKNKIRRALPEDKETLRKDKAELTEKITVLRKELKCNYAIEERSIGIQDTLDMVTANEIRNKELRQQEKQMKKKEGYSR